MATDQRPPHVDAHGACYVVNIGGIVHQVTPEHFKLAMAEQLVRPASAAEIVRYWRTQGYIYDPESGTYSQRQPRKPLLQLPE